MDLNYFICTLGQATLPNISRPYQDVNHLIDQQAAEHPKQPAVAFYTPNDGQNAFETQILTFEEVLGGVASFATAIRGKLTILDGQTVGLLCNTSPAFLFTWLGLIRLGHPVLLIAPQCSPSAIAHLSKACTSRVLFHDGHHEKLARKAVDSASSIGFAEMVTHTLPYEHDENVLEAVKQSSTTSMKAPSLSDTEVAYLHHTSGTSSGIPKPIPQTHQGGVGVLPSLDGSAAATFTTTPLYHGGVADLFRAWASSALIYLFPSQHVPITASNIVKCLDVSATATNEKQTAPVRYFSSVPYVLQMMAQDTKGLKLLQGMDVVGVGGAALPPEVGDRLVNNNVNLVSRYGSAECGFLMSSHRDYESDKEWQYLRQSEEVKHLKFEEQDNGLSELVVQPGWPHMAKRNRDDGSFATADLLAPHADIPNAWKYHSRADSQLALITGKKFDPAPLEGILAASSPLISEVLIFGNGKPYPGALLFRSEAGQDTSSVELVRQLAPVVEKLNIESQSHARIPRNMLVTMPHEITPLEKSSKGTILRNVAEDKYQQHIQDAYGQMTFAAADDVSDHDLPDAISRIVQSVVGDGPSDCETLTTNTDLFAYGVDSVACVQIRHALTQLVPSEAESLPLTVVEDSGTISRLSDLVMRYRRGEQLEKEDQNQLLSEVINDYATFNDIVQGSSTASGRGIGRNVLLTGPTGLLGVHVLAQLLSRPSVQTVYLLIRGATPHAAKERVLKSFTSRQLAVPTDFDRRVRVLPCKLSDSDLGLSSEDYRLLVDEVETIIHLAWSVNFLVSLRSLATSHLAGLQNLLNLALAAKEPPQFLFCSSVASISNLTNTSKVPETVVEDLSACGPTGYAQSKLAAELICFKCATTTRMRGRITVVRVGQLAGDTTNGVWNMSEAYPLMLASSRTTGTLPLLRNEKLNWLPVDTAAKCFLEAAFGAEDHDTLNGIAPCRTIGNEPSIVVTNLLNTSQATRFEDLVQTLIESGEHIKLVPIPDWLDALEQLKHDERTKDHPALRLLPFWKRAYGSDTQRQDTGIEPSASFLHDDSGTQEYQTTLSESLMPSLKPGIGPLEKAYVLKLWTWIKGCAT